MIAVYLPAEFRDIDDDATPEEETAVLAATAAAAGGCRERKLTAAGIRASAEILVIPEGDDQ